MEFKIGDLFEFKKPKNIFEIKGEIIDILDNHYRFKILECNKKHLIGRTANFLKDGKLIKWIKKI